MLKIKSSTFNIDAESNIILLIAIYPYNIIIYRNMISSTHEFIVEWFRLFFNLITYNILKWTIIIS